MTRPALIWIFTLLLPLTLFGCGGDTTPPPLSSSTAAVTLTSTIETLPAEVTLSVNLGSRPRVPFPLPAGELLEEWNSIPVMPNALEGGEWPSGGYAFTVRSSEESIIVFYDHEMAARGWLAYARGSTKDELFTTMLFYKQNEKVATIWVYQAGEDPAVFCLLITVD